MLKELALCFEAAVFATSAAREELRRLSFQTLDAFCQRGNQSDIAPGVMVGKLATRLLPSYSDCTMSPVIEPNRNLNPKGLTTTEASQRLAEYGENSFDSAKTKNGGLAILKSALADPMGLMLLGLSAIYFLLNHRTDALILLAAYVPITGVDLFLNFRSNRALELLKRSLSQRVHVYRDGNLVTLSSREIVPGDFSAITEGQRLPAYGILEECESLSVSEAALTGESLPVEKSLGDTFFGGTTVLGGRALGRIETTGLRTEFGKIAREVSEEKETSSPLRIKIDRIVKIAGALAALLASGLYLLMWVRFPEQTWMENLVASLTFGMSAIPEEFPLVFTLYLSLGAYRLSKRGVLIKSLPSVEAMGSVDVICTDKTGTLTLGTFDMESIELEMDIDLEHAQRVALLACEPEPIDAMDRAVFNSIRDAREIVADYELLVDSPFDPHTKTMSHLWVEKSETRQKIKAMKGAVEGVLSQCEIEAADRDRVVEKANALAASGKRLLGLASSYDESDRLKFLGLLVFSDPIRQSVPDSIRVCQASGIEIRMLTGDHLLTAHSVADAVGISHTHDQLFNGSELEAMSTEQREKAYLNGRIFARLKPDQKLALIQKLRASGLVVAMTGDGINDAPSLRQADVGISMGADATDVAREASKIVLTDSSFSGLVSALLEGRRIFQNLRRSFFYLIAFHTPIIVLSFVPSLAAWPMLLLPIHIVLLELLVHPVSAYSFETLQSQDAQGLQVKPLKMRSLVSRFEFIRSVTMGLIVSALALFAFRYGFSFEPLRLMPVDEPLGRSQAMAVILLGNLWLIVAETHRHWNRRTTWTVLILLASTAVATMSPIAVTLLHSAPVAPQFLIGALLMTSLCLLPRFAIREKVWPFASRV